MHFNSLSQASLNTHVVTEHMRGNEESHPLPLWHSYDCHSVSTTDWIYLLTYCSGPVLM